MSYVRPPNKWWCDEFPHHRYCTYPGVWQRLTGELYDWVRRARSWDDPSREDRQMLIESIEHQRAAESRANYLGDTQWLLLLPLRVN